MKRATFPRAAVVLHRSLISRVLRNPAETMRILIVEDEVDFLRTLAQAMREEGYAVDEARDGEEGLYKAAEAAAPQLGIQVTYAAITSAVMRSVIVQRTPSAPAAR